MTRTDGDYWRKAYESLVRQTGRDLNDGLGPDPRTPHPDTARMDWLEKQELSVWISDDDGKTIFDCLSEDLRAKIDAALKAPSR